jgi:hypothetical protein
MEVECIEPDLYFNLSEGSLERFVNAIVELIVNLELLLKQANPRINK